LELLLDYPWPGNIRELENAVVRAVAMCDGVIRVQDLPESIRNFPKQAAVQIQAGLASLSAPPQKEWLSLFEIEGRYVARVLAHTRGNKQAASRVLGVDRTTLQRMIKRHNISLDKISNPNQDGSASSL